MEQVVYAEIEVDRCVHCHGIWFDSSEAERLKTIQGSEILDDGSVELGDRYNTKTETILCPHCQSPMLQMLDIDQHSVWYEQCIHCHGIWLDAGEFTKFKENFTSPNLVNHVKRLLRRSS